MCRPRGHRGSRQGAQPVKQSDEKSQKQRHGMVILSSSNFHFTYVAELYLDLSCSSCRQHLTSVHERSSPTCTRSKADWSQQFLGSNGKLTHALAGCVEHSVRDGGRDPNQSKFADPFRTQRIDPATRDRLSSSAD